MNHNKLKLLPLCCLLAAGAEAASTDINDTVRLQDVVVTGARYQTDLRHLPYTVSLVGRNSLVKNERLSVLPTLQEQVPSLFVSSRGMLGYGVSTGAAGGMTLRGISSGNGQLLVLIDGHPQYMGVYGHSISDSYQTLMAEQVEVLRGPASVLYGSNAMGGVVNIVTRKVPQDGSRTEIGLGAGSWGTVMGDLSNQFRSGRFSSTVALQYARTDNHRPSMGFEQYGGLVKLGYDINSNWKAYADLDLTHFNASQPGSTNSPVLDYRQWITRGAAAIGLDNDYGWTSGGLSVYSNFGRHKINDGHAADAAEQTRLFRSRDALTGVNLYQSFRLFRGNRLTLGFDWQNIYGRAYYTSRETGEVLTTANKQSGHVHNNEVAGYIDLRQDITSWFTLDAGLRLDHHSVTGSEWIPQAGLVFRPVSTGELKLSVAKGFRNPTMREMYLYPPSNTDLQPERLWNYELSWRQRLLQGRLSYGVNLFYIDADNIIQTIERKNVNTGTLYNTGLEADLSYRLNEHWALSTNHSFLHMAHKVLTAPEYKGYLGADYANGRWAVSAGLQYVDGLYTSLAPEEQENFWLLNASVRYQLTPWLKLWVKGDNLLAQRYETLRGYPMPRATFMAGVRVRL